MSEGHTEWDERGDMLVFSIPSFYLGIQLFWRRKKAAAMVRDLKRKLDFVLELGLELAPAT